MRSQKISIGKRILAGCRVFAGILMLALGFVGLLLPVVPQIPFFVAAFLLLAPSSSSTKRFLAWFRLKWPERCKKISLLLRRRNSKKI